MSARDRSIAITRATALAALERFDLEVESVEILFVSENHTFQVTTTDGGRFAARVHRPGYSSDEELQSENVWVEALADAGITTTTAVRARDGSAHVAVEGDDGVTRQVGVLEWVDGRGLDTEVEAMISDGDPVAAAAFAAVGAVIARMHEATGTWTPPRGFVRRRWDVEGLLGDAAHWGRFWAVPALEPGQSEVLRATRDRLSRDLGEFGTGPDRFGMIHADLHLQNLLVAPDRSDELSADDLIVIDFDDSGFGWHVYDLAVPLYHVGGGEHGPTRRAAMVEGYRSVRSLPDEHLDMLPAFVLTRRLINIGWMTERVDLVGEPTLMATIERGCHAAEAYLSG